MQRRYKGVLVRAYTVASPKGAPAPRSGASPESPTVAHARLDQSFPKRVATAAACVNDLGRVRWHCRRGMLELDLVLSRFLERHFADLPPPERAAFKELLELSDNDLWDLVSGRLRPETPVAAAVVTLLRETCC